jgi:N-methylhydantoinase A
VVELRVAIDTGGTFTDCVTLVDGQLRVQKVLSSPQDPSLAVLDGLRQLGASPTEVTAPLEVRHGTTVGTNAVLERTGARVAFITTAGFEDTISIGRQARSRLYDWFTPAPVCLIGKEMRFGISERVSAEGLILLKPSDEEIADLVERVRASGAEAVAISLLFGFASPETEKRIETALQTLHIPVSAAHRILPEFREYERASTTVINAYLAPRLEQYLSRLHAEVIALRSGARVDVMQSSGGIIPVRVAALEPVRTVLSGPAGGVVGASAVAGWAGLERIIGLDMGGTSTDVFLADFTAGGTRLTRDASVNGMPISVPTLDIHTVGAGGGSIARFDAGGMLHVGPESAGADPGPICFGRGARATVTDANYIHGYLDAETFLGGGVSLNGPRTWKLMEEQKGALETVEDFAQGIVRVVESEMEKAIRVVSVERGHDIREFRLVAFGGGGPLHACSLARSLGIPWVLIPPAPGALSALGILLADTVRDFCWTVMLDGSEIERAAEFFLDLETKGAAEFLSEKLAGVPQRSMDLRYRGQGYELNVPWEPDHPEASLEAFHQLHNKSYGFSDPGRPIEIVNLKLRIIAKSEPYLPARQVPRPGDGDRAYYADRDVLSNGARHRARLYRRDGLTAGDAIVGPAIITEYSAATLLHKNDSLLVDEFGNLIITVSKLES